MRYLGNKTKLLPFIDSVIKKYNIEGETFADLFAGTGTVGDHFKKDYQVISNDFLYFSYVINKAKLLNATPPKFQKFRDKYNKEIFSWLNELFFSPTDYYFIYNNYSPVGERYFFSEKNAIKIDGIRIKIEELLLEELLNDAEYYFLLASLLESVTKVANTSGTFEAFFKFWERRSQNDFVILPLEIECSTSIKENMIYRENTNSLVRKIKGDIAYIDTPYTVTQYVSAYHMLETIAKYDFPSIKGVGGKRDRGNQNSLYARKKDALVEFEDLFRQIQFKHILVSYSTQGLVSIDELVNLAKKFAIDGEVFIEYQGYKEYKNHRSSNKGGGKKLKEVIIYFKKDNTVNKSPLNYSGSKDKLISSITKELPKHVEVFVDMMGGAFNVGANIVATKHVYYNEINTYIFQLMNWLLKEKRSDIVSSIKNTIDFYSLTKGGKEAYLELRNSYNLNQTVEKLYVLHLYSFQNMIRFNSNHQFNTPVGVAGFSEDMIKRIESFSTKTKNVTFYNKDFTEIDFREFPTDTIFYFDPPYFLTNASYNDGKRGNKGWDAEQETELLNYLSRLDEAGYKFILSNVIRHKDKVNHLLENWLIVHDCSVISVGTSGWRYAKEEVIIKNFK